MLELKNITKSYKVGEIKTDALDSISVSFRKNEFVAILGQSGSGKTTCLNIIGGLDRYDSGDLIINGKSTKDFKERDWDAYRNNSIGFVFQSYNLISHLNIVKNVEMSMTLSGVSKSEKHKKAIEVLERVGLKDHIGKRPNQLSGGQMQRVAIARALANDPDILLCDEPTGALDSTTSVQILDLIKEIASDKLVIMVTHNPDLANKYADRIVDFSDGKVVNDTNPYTEETEHDEFFLKKTSMSFFTALNLSFNNIKTKMGRTLLTAFASSIGIIGIAVILSLSVGFQEQIDDFQTNAMSEFPIMISKQAAEIDMEQMKEQNEEMRKQMSGKTEYVESDEIYLYNKDDVRMIHQNLFNQDYLDYIDNIDPNICKSVGYMRALSMNLVMKDNDDYSLIKTDAIRFASYPNTLSNESYIESNFDLLAGEYPKDENSLVIVVDNKNRIEQNIAKELGYDIKNIKSIKFSDITGTKLKAIMNDDYYTKTEYGGYAFNQGYEEMYSSKDSIELEIVGIVRKKQDVTFTVLEDGIAYSDILAQKIIKKAKSSNIVKEQKEKDYNVLSMEQIDEEEKEQVLMYLGADAIPFMITVYPINFDTKDEILKYLDGYNTDIKDDENKIIYNDLASTITGMTSGIMDGITMVLIAFSSTALVVSLIMISIIIYTSVLERTKEIGILKALGARKKDIARVFDAETFILGIISGTLGVLIAYLLTFPINLVILKATDLENVARLKLSHAVILVTISTILTMLGGHIPAKMASKKDAVEALRSE